MGTGILSLALLTAALARPPSAELLIRTGRPRVAMQQARQELPSRPDDIELMSALAVAESRSGYFADAAGSFALCEGTRLFALGESLGGVESLIGYPWSMSHAAFPPEEKLRTGISEGSVRLSVGIEDADDLCADLGQALDRAGR